MKQYNKPFFVIYEPNVTTATVVSYVRYTFDKLAQDHKFGFFRRVMFCNSGN